MEKNSNPGRELRYMHIATIATFYKSSEQVEFFENIQKFLIKNKTHLNSHVTLN